MATPAATRPATTGPAPGCAWPARRPGRTGGLIIYRVAAPKSSSSSSTAISISLSWRASYTTTRICRPGPRERTATPTTRACSAAGIARDWTAPAATSGSSTTPRASCARAWQVPPPPRNWAWAIWWNRIWTTPAAANGAARASNCARTPGPCCARARACWCRPRHASRASRHRPISTKRCCCCAARRTPRAGSTTVRASTRRGPWRPPRAMTISSRPWTPSRTAATPARSMARRQARRSTANAWPRPTSNASTGRTCWSTRRTR
ncbi:hypothetical protein LMG26691_04164 [Achromobacter animicus]|nr:hypothetical protein LMG26691_04164 [Achromobacter animicus]